MLNYMGSIIKDEGILSLPYVVAVELYVINVPEIM